MKNIALLSGLIFAGSLSAQTDALPPPGFHHLHLNSTNPDAAIAFYMRQFPTPTKATVAGLPALKAGKVYVLFTKVNTPPPTTPQTAIWHFGWHVVDVQENRKAYEQRKEVHLLPLYTTDEGGSVLVSSDTWPGANGSLGRTKAEIAEAKAKSIQPTHGAWFRVSCRTRGRHHRVPGQHAGGALQSRAPVRARSVLRGALVSKHLNARVTPAAGRAPYTEANCKVPRPERSWPALERGGMLRQPGGVTFDDVALTLARAAERHATCEQPRPPGRSHRTERGEPRTLDRQTSGGGREVPETAL